MQLTKHHGLGNDFLVLIDWDDQTTGLPELARAVCDRRTGVGADGLLRVTEGTAGADVTMELHNADGSRAEMSGNGIACLSQAVVLAGVVTGPHIEVATDAGRRSLRVEGTTDAGLHRATVDMGTIDLGEKANDWLGDGVEAARFAEAGNPHLVLHAPDAGHAPDLPAIGVRANDTIAGGINVEVIRAEGDGLQLDVYERGVGLTQACGTGASAAAAVAADWGLVGSSVDVTMPGGTAHLELGDTAVMTVPVTAVAQIDYLRAPTSDEGGDR